MPTKRELRAAKLALSIKAQDDLGEELAEQGALGEFIKKNKDAGVESFVRVILDNVYFDRTEVEVGYAEPENIHEEFNPVPFPKGFTLVKTVPVDQVISVDPNEIDFEDFDGAYSTLFPSIEDELIGEDVAKEAIRIASGNWNTVDVRVPGKIEYYVKSDDIGGVLDWTPDLGARKRPSAGPKRSVTPEQKEKFLVIWKNSELVEEAALHLWNEGQRVSITNVYHTIKGPLGLPGHYDFDMGDAIREVLHDAGWVKKEAMPGVLDWSPPQ